jgi:hypothetical protein
MTIGIGTGVKSLVLDRELLPLIDVAQAMEVVRKAVAVYAKVFGNEEFPGNEDECYESDCDPQGVQYVWLHESLPGFMEPQRHEFKQYVKAVAPCGATAVASIRLF